MRAYLPVDAAVQIKGLVIGVAGWKKAKRRLVILIVLSVVAILPTGNGYGQAQPTGGQISIPPSSLEKPGDAGVRVHTNIEMFTPNRAVAGPMSSSRSNAGGAADNGSQTPSATGRGDITKQQ
jgi:hypothetical protein